MPEQITKWITNDGYEYDTERQAILHEQYKEKIVEIATLILNRCYINSDESQEIAELICEHYNVEKKK